MNAAAETIARPPVIEMFDAAVTSTRAPDVAVVSGINWRVSLDDYWVIGGPTGKSDFVRLRGQPTITAEITCAKG